MIMIHLLKKLNECAFFCIFWQQLQKSLYVCGRKAFTLIIY